MRWGRACPKCGGKRIVRIPDHPGRYASGSNIYTSTFTLMGKVPVIRYVCLACGYVEHWVEEPEQREILAANGPLLKDFMTIL